MGHANRISCARCGQQMEATAPACPMCGAAHELASLPSEVPPALAILVALLLLGGVLALIGLLWRAPSPHHETPAPPPVVASAAPTPSAEPPPAAPSPRATPKPQPTATPGLPSGPLPGHAPQKLGMPPAPLPTFSPTSTWHSDGPKFPEYR